MTCIKTKCTIRGLLRFADIGFAERTATNGQGYGRGSRIDEEEHRTHPDEDLLHRLKKEKLKIKDELAGHLTH